MSPAPSKLGRRPVGDENEGIFIGPNVDTEWFTLYQYDYEHGHDDTIHFCDWPAARAAIDQFMADRAKEAGE